MLTPTIVQKLVTSFVQDAAMDQAALAGRDRRQHAAEYASAGKELYVQSIADTIGMFNGDGLMKPEAAQNALRILGRYSKNVAPVRDRIDLSATYTTQFVDSALRAEQQ